MKATTLLHQFCLHANVTPSQNDCWEWQGPINHGGYGLMRDCTQSAEYSGKPIRAHRFAYEQFIGPIAEGMVLDHLCRNRKCVNPYHLEPVSIGENVLRGQEARIGRKRDHCFQGHELTAVNVYIGKLGKRTCKTCHLQKSKENYRKRRDASKQPIVADGTEE
jgi:hypothetical protein